MERREMRIAHTYCVGDFHKYHYTVSLGDFTPTLRKDGVDAKNEGQIIHFPIASPCRFCG